MPKDSDGNWINQADAVRAWADAAREVLIRTAGTYNEVITYADLAERIQKATGITSAQQLNYWIDEVLGLVSDSQPPAEPALTALVVNAKRRLGPGYVPAMIRRYGEAIPEGEEETRCGSTSRLLPVLRG